MTAPPLLTNSRPLVLCVGLGARRAEPWEATATFPQKGFAGLQKERGHVRNPVHGSQAGPGPLPWGGVCPSQGFPCSAARLPGQTTWHLNQPRRQLISREV